jgi:gamma-glutamyltranspeptidase/glutathione hydrolase
MLPSFRPGPSVTARRAALFGSPVLAVALGGAALLPWLSAGSAAMSAAPAAPAHRAGAVASGHAKATAAGLGVLADGGNAVDAAVATALALAVVYPEAGNLGGGGFAVVRIGGEVSTLDFREAAPAAARAGMYLDASGQPNVTASRVGPLAAGVPASGVGLWELQRRFGRLPWARVVAPAVELARGGCEVDAHLHQRLANEETRKVLASFPETAALWLPGGEAAPVGVRIPLPALAATLDRYAREGPAAITTGPVAAAIAAASRRHGGILEAGDLAAYRPEWRAPVTFDAFGWHIATMPLPSAGGILLGQTCGMLQRLGWAALPRDGADRAHLLAEVFRRGAADRALLGDPLTSRVTAAELLDPRWIAARAASIDPRRATSSAALAAWPNAGLLASAAAGGGKRGGETTHLSTVDGDGNAVALTTTLNGLFGCGLFVPELGFLNNEMDDFLVARAADADGRPAPNGVSPGKRMLSSMTPTIAWRGDELIALGARGSRRIPTHTAQVLLALLVDDLALQPAVDRPRLHQQDLPDRLEVEPGALSAAVSAELERRGHHLATPTYAEHASINAVRRRGDGTCEAAVDPRGAAALGGAGVLRPGAAGAAGARKEQP